MKLAFLISHPIQYQVSLFKKLSAHPNVDLTVYYCSNMGATEKLDREFNIVFKWDIPLLEGYKYKFLKNYSPWPKISPFGLINFGIIRELLINKYDVIIIHGYSITTNLLAYFGAWISKTPVIFRGETTLRINRPWWIKLLKYVFLKIIFRGTSAFLTIGSKSEEFYLYYGVPRKKLFFTPYAVDNDFFISESDKYRQEHNIIKKELDIAQNLSVILFAGKLVPRKRPFDLLKAFEQLENKSSALVFVGDGELKNNLETYAKENGVSNVYFSGFVNQSGMPKFYGIADIFVLPSEYEVSPLVINEAMCGKLPIVVSDAVPSANDFVKEGKNGFIYPVGNIKRLKECLKILLNNLGLRNKMAEQSRIMIKDWNYDTCVMNIIQAVNFIKTESNEKNFTLHQ